MYIQSQTLSSRRYWDMAGVSASFLCVLHCLVTPFLVTALPLLAATEHETHSILALLMLLIGALAFVPGYRKHRQLSVPLAGLVGLAAVVGATQLPESEASEQMETLLVVAGGLTLIAAHLRNAYWCRFCRTCQCGDDSCALQNQPLAAGRQDEL